MSATDIPEAQSAEPERCANCDAVLTGEYCAACGEHRLDAHDLRLGSFLRRTFHNITNIDAGLLRSLRALVLHPGFLTLEFIRGRRRRYLQPLDLFLLVNLGYFVLQAVLPNSAFTTPLDVQLHKTPHRHIAQRMVDARLREITPPGADMTLQLLKRQEYARAFDANTHTQAKSLVILMVPLLALLLAILFAGTGRPAVQHIVFALHFYAWFMLALLGLVVFLRLIFVLVSLVMLALGRPWNAAFFESDDFTSTILVVAIGSYLYAGFRTAYASSRLTAALRALPCVAGVAAALFLYRMILFFTVFYATR